MKRSMLLALGLVLAHGQEAEAQSTTNSQPSSVFTISAYCHCAKCCGQSNQPAANGRMPVVGVTIAGPRWIPLGTHVWIEGLGERIVTDRLTKRYDDRFDIFLTTHDQARQFGLQELHVTIISKP